MRVAPFFWSNVCNDGKMTKNVTVTVVTDCNRLFLNVLHVIILYIVTL